MARSKSLFQVGTKKLFFDGFAQAATLPPGWAVQDTSAAGSPTLERIDGDADGVFQLKHDNTDEAQKLTLYLADGLVAPALNGIVWEARIKVNGLTLSADQRVVAGLASARNATLDSVAESLWFRLEGASDTLLYEYDDGTTTADDQSTGVDLYDDTFVTLGIDMTDLANIKFIVDGGIVATVDMKSSLEAGSVQLQPFFEIQKDAGTETTALEINYCRMKWQASL